MNQRRLRRPAAVSRVIDVLEGRALLSGSGSAVADIKGDLTKTTLAVSTGALEQPIALSVTVRGSAAAGSPQGTVNILDRGQLLGTLTLSPTTSTNARYAYSAASQILAPEPGGSALFIGKHALTAVFVPSGTAMKSSASKTFAVSKPAYTKLAGGVEIATVSQGSGPQIQTGQTASVLYTGYLAENRQNLRRLDQRRRSPD